MEGMDVSSGTGPVLLSGRPWVERYRPKTLKDVSHQTEVVSTLENAVSTGRLPHLLFYGPPGSGKTSVALALCRQLWPPSEWRRRVLELNASDERGISVVREKIKHFASLSVGSSSSLPSSTKQKKSFFATTTAARESQPPSNNEDKDDNGTPESYPNPPYKIIILDEADTVTPDAQAALRRIIEAYSKITRFILICNYVTRIIEPLASRCAKFRFQALPPETMKDRLLQIANEQNCDTAQIDAILEVAQGDMRRAVTTLQSAHSIFSYSSDAATMTKDDVCEIAGLPKQSVVQHLLHSFTQGSFDAMKLVVDQVVAEGYSAQLLLLALLPLLAQSTQLTDLDKAHLCMKMATAEHSMVQGADETLQLLSVGSTAVQCFAKSKRNMHQ